ncbi:DUF4153 domain-containing protein [Metabacillus sp. HB246100]
MQLTARNSILCFSCGVLFHYFFYNKGVGVSYPLYVFYLYLLFFLVVKNNKEKQTIFDYMMLGAVLFLSMNVAFSSNLHFHVLNILLVPLLMFVHMIHSRRWDVKQWSNRLFVHSLFLTFFESVGQFFKLFKVVQWVGKGFATNERYQTIKKVGIGFLISVPLLWAVLFLLISSDQQFELLLGRIPDYLYQANMGSIFFQIVLVLFVSFAIYAFFIVLARPLVFSGEQKQSIPIKMDKIIISTILLLVNIVYLLYTVVQFTYFFNSDPASASLNYTYAEYARRGFTELTFVAVINLGILFVVTHLGNAETPTLPRIIKILLSSLVLFTFVMLASGFFRLSLYEQAYGYTYSRVLAHSFMILLGMLLCIAMYKVFNERCKLLRAMFAVSLIGYVVINYVNIDQFIVKKNLERYEATGKLDFDYLDSLSDDAIPLLVELQHDRMDDMLIVKYYERQNDATTWQSYNVSRERAKSKLKEWREERGS